MFSLRKNHLLQAIAVVILIWLIFEVRTVLVAFFIAFLITTVLHPVVKWLRARHIPTAISVALTILVLIAILALLGYYVAPQLASESHHLAKQAPSYVSAIKHNGLNLHFFNVKSLTNALQAHFGTISGVLISATRTALEIIVAIISIFIVTIYWLGSYDRVQRTLLTYFPKDSQARAADIWARIEKKLVSWVAAQVLLGIVVGVLVWIGALILGLPYAGVLGVIAGLLEIVPTLGSIAAAIPGILLGLTISWQTAVGALILYVVVNQLEGHVLAPWLLGRTVRLSPIVIILSLLVGATLYGILGAFIAVPLALVISSFVDSYREGEPKLKPSSRQPGKQTAATAS